MTDGEKYIPKIGDRVRVTIEGEIRGSDQNGSLFRVGLGRNFAWFDTFNTPPYVTVEKLQDPEPVWVDGDVIEVQFEYTTPSNPHGPRVAARIDGRWVFTDNGETAGPHFMHNHWPRVKTLHKQDAPPAEPVKELVLDCEEPEGVAV